MASVAATETAVLEGQVRLKDASGSMSALEVRLACRHETFTQSTSGYASGSVQANLIVLPSRYASDFRDLCARNPVPCPLIAESHSIGSYSQLKSHLPRVLDGERIATSLDMRTDCPRFNVYQDSKLAHDGILNVVNYWTEDHVAFLIGCSYSFETALTAAGLPPRHTLLNRTTPVYRTNIPLNPSGVFTGGTYVVSMRPYRKSDIETVRAISRRYLPTHGECIAWGWDAVEKLGVKSIDLADWGDAPLTMDGRPLGEVFGDEENVPVFWGCGVTPQEAVVRADLEGIVLSHTPSHMLVLDCQDDVVIS